MSKKEEPEVASKKEKRTKYTTGCDAKQTNKSPAQPLLFEENAARKTGAKCQRAVTEWNTSRLHGTRLQEFQPKYSCGGWLCTDSMELSRLRWGGRKTTKGEEVKQREQGGKTTQTL